MSEKKKPILRQVLALVGIVSFCGSTAFATSRIFRDALTQPNIASESTEPGPQERLAAQERGYEKVLQREPQNQLALEGLVQVRLQMNNPKGAVESLESLVKLYPDRYDYQAMLIEVKQQLEQEEPSGPPSSP